MKCLKIAAGLAVALCTALPAVASTINPADYELIYTEGRRTTTIDGANISGNAARANNRGIGRFNIGALAGPMDVLLAGKVARTGRDQWESRNVSGWLSFDVLNYTATRSNNTDPFSARFDVIVNGTVAQSVTLSGSHTALLSTSLSPILLDEADVRLRVKSISGRSSYDISASIQPIPVAASFPLLLSAGGALVWAGRRKARKS